MRVYPGTPQRKIIAHVRTVFTFVPRSSHDEHGSGLNLSSHQSRQLESQVKICLAVHARPKGTCWVMEVFSPPRFAIQAEEAGFRARSYDLKTGFDFRRARDRKIVEEDLISDPPELLVLCPPCTDESGWVHLNCTRGDRMEYLKCRAQSQSYIIRWCCKLFRIQTRNGGSAMFEHPTGSRLWTYPEMQSLCRVFETVKLHICAGMVCACHPVSTSFVRVPVCSSLTRICSL